LDEQEESAPSFLAGAWLNRRWTRSSSSIVLALIPTVLVIVSGGRLPVIGPALAEAGLMGPSTAPFVFGITVAFTIANLVLFPFAREIYFRSTASMREGLDDVAVFGVLFLVVIIGRVVTFAVIWVLSIPMGIVGILTLGAEDRQGAGWRID
jgi:hypothetical protein